MEADTLLAAEEASRAREMEEATQEMGSASVSMDADFLAQSRASYAAALAEESKAEPGTVVDMETDLCWPPRLHVPLISFSVAPTLTPGARPSFAECCVWAGHASSETLSDAVEPTSFKSGALSLLEGLEGPIVAPVTAAPADLAAASVSPGLAPVSVAPAGPVLPETALPTVPAPEGDGGSPSDDLDADLVGVTYSDPPPSHVLHSSPKPNVGVPVEHPANLLDPTALTCSVRPGQQGSSLEVTPIVAPNKLLSGSTMESPSPPVVTSLLGTRGPPPTVLATGVVTQASSVGAPPTSSVLGASLSTVTGDTVFSPLVDVQNNNRASVTSISSLEDSRSPTVGGLDGVCSAPPLSPHKAMGAYSALPPSANEHRDGVSTAPSTESRRCWLRPPSGRGVLNDVAKSELVTELARRSGRPLRRPTPLPHSSGAERTWAQQLRGSAPSAAYPVSTALPPTEGVTAYPYLSFTVLEAATGGRTSGPVASSSEYRRIDGPLLEALTAMCSGRKVKRLWCSLGARDISPIMTFGNNSAAGRLRAWDLAMASRFGSCRTFRTGRHSVAAGIITGVAERGDEEMWDKLGRLLANQSFPTAPPPPSRTWRSFWPRLGADGHSRDSRSSLASAPSGNTLGGLIPVPTH